MRRARSVSDPLPRMSPGSWVRVPAGATERRGLPDAKKPHFKRVLTRMEFSGKQGPDGVAPMTKVESLLRKCSVAARLYEDTRGAVLVEYTVLVGAVALAGSLGIVLIGTAVAKNFEFVRGMLLAPIP